MRISDWSSDVCSSDLPPAYGLAGVDSVVFTGDGPNLSYWNRYVAVTQMGGEGVFSDPRVGSHLDPGTPGLASDWRPGMVVANGKQDKVSDVLAALQAYQLSIDRKSVVWGKGVSGRVNLGGRR